MEKGLCCNAIRHGVEGRERMYPKSRRVKVCTIYADTGSTELVDIRWSPDFLGEKELFITDVMKDVSCELGACFTTSSHKFSCFLKSLLAGEKKQKNNRLTLR